MKSIYAVHVKMDFANFFAFEMHILGFPIDGENFMNFLYALRLIVELLSFFDIFGDVCTVYLTVQIVIVCDDTSFLCQNGCLSRSSHFVLLDSYLTVNTVIPRI